MCCKNFDYIKSQLAKLQSMAENVLKEGDSFMEKISTDERLKKSYDELLEKAVSFSNDFENKVNEIKRAAEEKKNEADKFNNMSRAECVEYIKKNHIKTNFDIEEASGEKLRSFLTVNKAINHDWMNKVKDILHEEFEKGFNKEDKCSTEACENKKEESKLNEDEIEIEFEDSETKKVKDDFQDKFSKFLEENQLTDKFNKLFSK